MTLIDQWVPVLALTAPTMAHVVQIVLAATLPLGTAFLLGKPKVRTVNWFDMLRVIGILIVPTVVVLAIRGIVPPDATAGVLGIAFGHLVTFLDTD